MFLEKIGVVLFRKKVGVTKPHLFQLTTITLLIILTVEILVGIYFLEDSEIKEVCSQLSITDCNDAVSSNMMMKIFYAVVKYTSLSSVILMLVVSTYLTYNWIIASLIFQREEKTREVLPRALTEVLIGSLSAGAIPTGISLIICAVYDLNLIKYMSGVELYIAFAGLSIIFIAFLSTLRQQAQLEKREIKSVRNENSRIPETET
jgi:hypothetical protein